MQRIFQRSGIQIAEGHMYLYTKNNSIGIAHVALGQVPDVLLGLRVHTCQHYQGSASHDATSG
jgi:hypothetical protein